MSRLQAGEKMPDFDVDIAFGTPCKLSELADGSHMTAIWVLRYLGCTMCHLDIHQISEHHAAFEEKGIKVLIVIQSTKETVEGELEASKLPISLICDPNETIYKALQIPVAGSKEERMPKTEEGKDRLAKKREMVKNLGIVHGKYEGQEQQLPAFFVVDQDMTAHYVHYATHSVDIPNSYEALEIIAKL